MLFDSSFGNKHLLLRSCALRCMKKLIELDNGRCCFESYFYGTMRVKVQALTFIPNANGINARALTPYSHSTVKTTLVRESPLDNINKIRNDGLASWLVFQALPLGSCKKSLFWRWGFIRMIFLSFFNFVHFYSIIFLCFFLKDWIIFCNSLKEFFCDRFQHYKSLVLALGYMTVRLYFPFVGLYHFLLLI